MKKPAGMRYTVRFFIGRRLGTKGTYSVRDICICLADRYSLKEHELCTIFTLHAGEKFENEDMIVERVS